MRHQIVWGVIACGFAASAAAQSAPCTPGVKSYVGNGIITEYGMPYSATLVVTFDKKLADGTTIHGVTRTVNARATSGLGRMETSLGCGKEKDGTPYDIMYVRIADPGAGTFLDWTTGRPGSGGGSARKEAVLRHEPKQVQQKPPVLDVQAYEREQNVPGQPKKIIKSEALGSNFINGVAVVGQRITVTVPVGEEGNSTPIVEWHERWVSKELGITMHDIVEDPERGRTEMVLENFSRLEPDPALFIPPAGYTVKRAPEKVNAQ